MLSNPNVTTRWLRRTVPPAFGRRLQDTRKTVDTLEIAMRFLNVADFGGCQNETFDVNLGESTLTLTLVEIRKLKTRPVPGQVRDPFSLIFQSQMHVVLPQKIYNMHNSRIGNLGIFIVPVGRNAHGIFYEALFN
jgi:hypothetical protein